MPPKPSDAFVRRAEAALRVRGGRISNSRRALLSLIGSAPRPLGPAALHAELRRRGVPIDRVSVYRNLTALLELGLVHRALGSTAVRPCAEPHEAAARERCHHAIVCSSCGAAAEFHSAAVERALREVRRSTGYRVQGHLLELRGLCAKCQAKA